MSFINQLIYQSVQNNIGPFGSLLIRKETFSIRYLFCIQQHLTFTNRNHCQGQPFNNVIQAVLMKVIQRVFGGNACKRERQKEAEYSESAI